MKKVVCILKSLLPMLFWMGLQSVLSMLFMGAGILTGKGPLWAVEGEIPYVISIIANGVTFLLGYVWLKKRQKETFLENCRVSFAAAAALLVLGVCFQLAVSLLLIGTEMIFPRAMESYAQVLENLGVFAPSVFSVLYMVVLAPLGEEMVFRGVTLHILERELPFWAANVCQAVLFALMHGNLVQSSYAFLAGLLLGCIVKKYGKLGAAIWCHFAVNVSGLFLGGVSIPGMFLLLAVGMAILVVFVQRNKKVREK